MMSLSNSNDTTTSATSSNEAAAENSLQLLRYLAAVAEQARQQHRQQQRLQQEAAAAAAANHHPPQQQPSSETSSLIETDTYIRLAVAIPGVARASDVTVDIQRSVLLIRGVRSIFVTEGDGTGMNSSRMVRKRFFRRYAIDTEVVDKQHRAKANLDRGAAVLVITAPKKSRPSTSISIEVTENNQEEQDAIFLAAATGRTSSSTSHMRPTLDRRHPPSPEVAESMASGLRRLASSTIGVMELQLLASVAEQSNE
jgi:HSP20 family molecular chaperone IbpA